jgi:PTS system mannitol-specific IIA component
MKNFIKKLSKKKKNKKDEFKIKLTNNLVLFNQKTISKKEAIDVVGNILLKNNYISNEYIKSMHLRDKDLSVYVGNGVAIPHGTNKSQKYIKKSGVSISIYPKGID